MIGLSAEPHYTAPRARDLAMVDLNNPFVDYTVSWLPLPPRCRKGRGTEATAASSEAETHPPKTSHTPPGKNHPNEPLALLRSVLFLAQVPCVLDGVLQPPAGTLK